MTDDALDELWQRAYRYALSLTHHADEARDLVQDACLAVGRRGGPWDIAYLIPVVRNRFIDARRRARRVAFEPLAEHDVPTEPTVADVGVRRQLDVALSRLRPSDRELLYLSAVEGYTAAQLASLRGQPRGTVLSALHRAKSALRATLGVSASTPS